MEVSTWVSTVVWPQSGHFRLVFGAARKAGILPPEGEPGPRVTHVGFGLVLGDDGKRFRTRSSEVSFAMYSCWGARPCDHYLVWCGCCGSLRLQQATDISTTRKYA